MISAEDVATARSREGWMTDCLANASAAADAAAVA